MLSLPAGRKDVQIHNDFAANAPPESPESGKREGHEFTRAATTRKLSRFSACGECFKNLCVSSSKSVPA